MCWTLYRTVFITFRSNATLPSCITTVFPTFCWCIMKLHYDYESYSLSGAEDPSWCALLIFVGKYSWMTLNFLGGLRNICLIQEFQHYECNQDFCKIVGLAFISLHPFYALIAFTPPALWKFGSWRITLLFPCLCVCLCTCYFPSAVCSTWVCFELLNL